ncbi:MAG: ABC transporter permease [Desulfurococcaceae archaeon]
MEALRVAKLTLRKSLKKTRFRVGLVLVAALVVLAITAPYIAPYPLEGLGYVYPETLARRLQPPSLNHPFGTDLLGRDLFSRVLIATRTALVQVLVVAALSLLTGIFVGVIAAYFKGPLEMLLNYFVELFMSIPTIVIALLFRMVFGQGMHVVITSLVVVWWAWYARIAYVYAKSFVEMDYVILAKLSGLNPFRIIMRHVARNTLQPMLVQTTSDLGSILLEASAINFMGLGLPQGSPEWGVMVYEAVWGLGLELFKTAPWLGVFPGLFILVSALGFSLVADTLREEMDPRLRKKWRLWF